MQGEEEKFGADYAWLKPIKKRITARTVTCALKTMTITVFSSASASEEEISTSSGEPLGVSCSTLST